MIFIAIWTDTSGLTERALTQSTKQIIDDCPEKDKIIEMLDVSRQHEELFTKAKNGVVEAHSGAYLIIEQKIANDLYRPLITFLWQELNKSRYYSYLIVAVQTEYEYRIGFRSKNNLDVSKIAKKFGGGGHKTSAGVRTKEKSLIKDSIEYALKEFEIS